MISADVPEYINDLFSRRQYKLIVDFVNQELKRDRTDHWLLGVLASAYYELREYDKSQEVLSEALKIKEECPLLWWHLAGTLEGLGDVTDAITVWDQIISFDKCELCFLDDPCWESQEFKEGLIADSYFRIGKAYLGVNDSEIALNYIKQFLERKILSEDEELESIYSIKDGLSIMKKLGV